MEYCEKCNGLIGKYEYPYRCPYCKIHELLERIANYMDGQYVYPSINVYLEDMNNILRDIKDKRDY